MIAFCARARLGLDPALLIGGAVPQLGGNAGAGEGWLVVEGDESDRSVAALPAGDRRAHERRARPPQRVRARCAELEALFEDWLARVPHVVRGERSRRSRLELAVPGEHNRRNAAAALAALELAGVAARRRASRARRVHGRRPAVRACTARRAA